MAIPSVPKKETEEKYSHAVRLYADTRLSLSEICERTGVRFVAFSSYLCKYHRELILERHGLAGLPDVRLRGVKGQTTASRHKYREAIAACDSTEYIEYNISQIARIFGVDCSSLAGQLRRHYRDIVPRREEARRRLGIAVNLQYGARPWCMEEYAEAVEMLRTTDLAVAEAAEACNVSPTGLREHLTAWHPELVARRESRRSEAVGQKTRGERNGAWNIHAPRKENTEKYGQALHLYRTTALTIEEIVAQTGVNPGGFAHHLRMWHPELVAERRGFDGTTPLTETKRYRKDTAEKYIRAIERLRTSDLPTAKVAAEFGMKPETFRTYLREHCPELAEARGMTKTGNGRTVSRRSADKYAEALHLYETTSEPLRSIAGRLGLTYNSVGGFIRRNHPEAIERHNALLTSAAETFAEGIERLRNGSETVNAVMDDLGYGEYFRHYVKEHHPELLERRRERRTVVRKEKTAGKYAGAIASLRAGGCTMKEAAERHGVNLSSFRKYLYKHEPELLKERREKEKNG